MLHVSYQSRVLGKITATFGVASYPQSGRDGDCLVSAADSALYQANAMAATGLKPPADLERKGLGSGWATVACGRPALPHRHPIVTPAWAGDVGAEQTKSISIQLSVSVKM